MSDDDLLDEGGGGGAPGALPGGGGSGLELPLREGDTDELELLGEGGLKPGGFMAGLLAPTYNKNRNQQTHNHIILFHTLRCLLSS